MKKLPPVAQMFEYRPGQIILSGFKPSHVLNKISGALGQEASLRKYQIQIDGKRSILPCFPVGYAAERQAFFNSLPNGLRLGKSVFEREFPREIRRNCSSEYFLDFCSHVYETIQAIRQELTPLKHLPYARRVVSRLNNFDKGLENTLRAFQKVEESHTFALDTQSGVIVNIDQMPSEANAQLYRADRSERWGDMDSGLVKTRMKKAALSLAKQGLDDFKGRIMRYVRDEFRYDPSLENVRGYFEQLGVPVRLHAKYERFLTRCLRTLEDAVDDDAGRLPDIAHPVYAKLRDHYDIVNLFPPSLLDEHAPPEEAVPINFKTDAHEKKFLIVGLHSGGKSFFLDNLVLTSLAAQTPLRLPADSVMIPSYDQIRYYRNVGNGGRGEGKAVYDIGEIDGLIDRAGPKDCLFFDEFLDSATSDVATWIGPELFSRMAALRGTTVFVSTHRGYDYGELERQGWVIMTPQHTIRHGRVVPLRRIERGRPNEPINRRYVEEKYRKEKAGRAYQGE